MITIQHAASATYRPRNQQTYPALSAVALNDRALMPVMASLWSARTAIVPVALLYKCSAELAAVTAAKRSAKLAGAATTTVTSSSLFALRLYGFMTSSIDDCLPFFKIAYIAEKLAVSISKVERAMRILNIKKVKIDNRDVWSVPVPNTINQLNADYVMLPRDAVRDLALTDYDCYVLALAQRVAASQIDLGLVADQRLTLTARDITLPLAALHTLPAVGKRRERESIARLVTAGYAAVANDAITIIAHPRFKN